MMVLTGVMNRLEEHEGWNNRFPNTTDVADGDSGTAAPEIPPKRVATRATRRLFSLGGDSGDEGRRFSVWQGRVQGWLARKCKSPGRSWSAEKNQTSPTLNQDSDYAKKLVMVVGVVVVAAGVVVVVVVVVVVLCYRRRRSRCRCRRYRCRRCCSCRWMCPSFKTSTRRWRTRRSGGGCGDFERTVTGPSTKLWKEETRSKREGGGGQKKQK